MVKIVKITVFSKERENMKELWKDIPEYEGLYQVSTIGRIRSLDTVIEYRPRERKPYTRIIKGRMLKTYCDPRGYEYVSLHKNGEGTVMLVHRIVAATFLENNYDCDCVGFIDGNKKNIRPNNLKWVKRSDLAADSNKKRSIAG